jgi:predicted Zn finger-like uncharacterized protein
MTMFRVVPDQLRISEGWVRCGQCEEVFDAAAHMQEPALENNASGSSEAHDVLAAEVESAFAPVTPQRSEDSSRIEPVGDVQSELDVPYSSHYTQRSSDETLVSEVFSQAPAQNEEHSQSTSITEIPQPSFMRAGQTEVAQHKPWVRVSLYLSLLLLGLGLMVQVLMFERDRIAVLAPDVKPVIQVLCDLMHCTLEPLQQIESVVMDSSSFNKLKGEIYRLNFTLKNTSQIPLALPAIELSLMDAQDQALIRRVISPGELGMKLGVLAAATESSASLALTVKTPSGSERVAGYRVLAFYP